MSNGRTTYPKRYTFKDLAISSLDVEHKFSKTLITELLSEVLANTGADVFEEGFKLVFTKLYDEHLSASDRLRVEQQVRSKNSTKNRRNILHSIDDTGFRELEFRCGNLTGQSLKKRIQGLFDRAQLEWSDVFPEGTKYELESKHLESCVLKLQDFKLFDDNLQIVDEVFEHLVVKSSKGVKGQYFTPRHVIDMCVKMLNPKREETMIDTASGSYGFPIHTIFNLLEDPFGGAEPSAKDKQSMLNVFGIDFDEKTVRIARALGWVAGGDESNILKLDALDYQRWRELTDDNRISQKHYGEAFGRLKRLRADRGDNRHFNFDIVMSNPPFAGSIKDGGILNGYELGMTDKGNVKKSERRDVLFLERNMCFLKPGGRMAIVLPQGRFNNRSDQYVRNYVTAKARILGVVSLHENTFRPHTGIKTSVLFAQKWDTELCPKSADYPIFFAVSENGGKNSSGDYVYSKSELGKYLRDGNGRQLLDHDLHSQNSLRPDGIAEKFIEWAITENLSFWRYR